MRAVPSQPMGCFPWDTHRNDIPMDKPGHDAFHRSSELFSIRGINLPKVSFYNTRTFC